MRAPALAAAGLTELPAAVAGDWLADPAHWAALRAELPAVVADFCARDPLAPGMPTEAARASMKLPSRELITALASGDIVQDGGYLRIFARHAVDVGTVAAPAPPAGPPCPTRPLPASPPGPVRPPRPTGLLSVSPGASAGVPGDAAGRLPPAVAAAVQTVLDDLAGEPFAAPDTERLRALGLDAKALAAAARAGLLLRVADLVALAPGAAAAGGRDAGRTRPAVHHLAGAPGAAHLPPGGHPAA